MSSRCPAGQPHTKRTGTTFVGRDLSSSSGKRPVLLRSLHRTRRRRRHCPPGPVDFNSCTRNQVGKIRAPTVEVFTPGRSSNGGGLTSRTEGSPSLSRSFATSRGSCTSSRPPLKRQPCKPSISTARSGRSTMAPGPNVVKTWLCRRKSFTPDPRRSQHRSAPPCAIVPRARHHETIAAFGNGARVRRRVRDRVPKPREARFC